MLLNLKGAKVHQAEQWTTAAMSQALFTVSTIFGAIRKNGTDEIFNCLNSQLHKSQTTVSQISTALISFVYIKFNFSFAANKIEIYEI